MQLRMPTLISKLSKNRIKTLDFFNSLSPEEWQLITYSEGEAWTVMHVMTHIAQSEKHLGVLIKQIVDTGLGVPEDFDVDRFNQKIINESAESSAAQLMKDFDSYRKKNMEIFGSFKEEELDKIGYHPYFGNTRVEEMIKMLMIHIHLHIRDIKALRQA